MVCFDGNLVWTEIHGSPSFYDLRVDKPAGQAGQVYLQDDISAHTIDIDAGSLLINGATATVTGPGSPGSAIQVGDAVGSDDALLASSKDLR